jgi:hypothetical protein
MFNSSNAVTSVAPNATAPSTYAQMSTVLGHYGPIADASVAGNATVYFVDAVILTESTYTTFINKGMCMHTHIDVICKTIRKLLVIRFSMLGVLFEREERLMFVCLRVGLSWSVYLLAFVHVHLFCLLGSMDLPACWSDCSQSVDAGLCVECGTPVHANTCCRNDCMRVDAGLLLSAPCHAITFQE